MGDLMCCYSHVQPYASRQERKQSRRRKPPVLWHVNRAESKGADCASTVCLFGTGFFQKIIFSSPIQ